MIHQNALKSNSYLSWFHQTKRKKIQEMYLDWVNNFLTVVRFAEYYNISEDKANRVINTGRFINETAAQEKK